MKTVIKETISELNQKVAEFHGEGAYHGANKPREVDVPESEDEEFRPTTLIGGKQVFKEFDAYFPNFNYIIRQMPVPSQEEIKNDGVTFAWASLETALQEAGPLTKSILVKMEASVERNKKYVYIDSKIQYFKKGDIPVDSKLWHVDGSISVRDSRATKYGFPLLHDLKARQECKVSPPQYLAYQSSTHCATQWLSNHISLWVPACIPSFDEFDQAVSKKDPMFYSQPAGSIVKFDGLSIHRAVPATDDGWRLWIRCTETDREIKVPEHVANNYGIVYRPNQ
jgi:hypothetical protein